MSMRGGRGTGRGGRGTGRGASNTRGRGCRGNIVVTVPNGNHSDEEENLVDNESCNEDLNVVPILGEDDDDDDSDDMQQSVNPIEERLGGEKFTELADAALGDENHRLNYTFNSGLEQSYQSLEKYRFMSEIEIVLSLSERFFQTLLECSNQDPRSNIHMKDLYLYHAFLALRTLHRFDKIESYWNPSPQHLQWLSESYALINSLSLSRFYHIRSCLKGYMPEDDIPIKSRGWKVARPVFAVQQSFQNVLTSPGEYLSVDEGMARGSSCRNPIYVSLGKAKPLEGFRFFLLCDYQSKIVVNFMLDTKDLTADNCATRPGKFAGAIIDELCSQDVLPGRYYKIFADNYYNTFELTNHMLRNRQILVSGTLQRNLTPRVVHFGTAKRPKPSRQFPKGSLKMAKSKDESIYFYSWMDSAGVYFIDPIAGPGHVDRITRKNSMGTRVVFQVPSMIAKYNRYMHGVGVFDQVREYFGCDLTHPTRKYTVRAFEILWSMILAQAYNIHRYVHSNSPQLKDRTTFMTSIISGFMQHQVVCSTIAPHFDSANHKLLEYPPTMQHPVVCATIAPHGSPFGVSSLNAATFCTVKVAFCSLIRLVDLPKYQMSF